MPHRKPIAMVTGATAGVGRETALAFARAGYDIAACGRREDRLAALGDEAVALGADVLTLPVDVTDADAVDAFFNRIVGRFGRIDVVFNNAGRFAPATNFGDTDVDEWRQTIDVNLNGAFYVAHAAYRAMKTQDPQGGRIINNGSISAHVPRPHAAAYTASKHAITGLTRAIALDGRAFSIACGQIDIGNAATEMTSAMQSGVLQADGSMRPEATFDVRYVAEAVLHMASLPLDANILTMTVMATAMPYVGRG